MTKRVAGMLVAMLGLWLSFWWGHYFGVATADRTWLSATDGDRYFLQTLIEHKPDHRRLAEGVQTQIRSIEGRAELFGTRQDSIGWFFAYPVLAPFQQKILADMRNVR